MAELRRSERVRFKSESFELAGIVDLPVDAPKGFIQFSHCFTCNKDLKAIVRLSRRMASNGWGVLRYDFRGLGDSQGTFAESNFETNQIDVRSAYRFLSEQFEAPRLLVGHSFGGAVSIGTAQELTSVLGVSLIAAPSDTKHLAELLIRMSPDIESAGSGNVTIGGRNHQINRQMIDNFRKVDLPGLISRLEKPVQIFHSLQDETLRYEHATRIFGLLSHKMEGRLSGASLITLPTSDHLLVNNSADISFIADSICVWLDYLVGSNDGS